MKSLALPVCILLMRTAAHGMAENPPPDPSLCGPYPTNYKEIVNKWLETQLIDAASARIEWNGDPKPADLAKEGRQFGKEATERILVKHDLAFLSSRLSPAARQENPPSMQQEFMSEIEKLGTPVSPPQVQGDIQFQSQFFEPSGNFTARVNYPARGAQLSINISHPVGRWQIDSFSFLPESAR